MRNTRRSQNVRTTRPFVISSSSSNTASSCATRKAGAAPVIPTPRGYRALALATVAMYDATIAAGYSKSAYQRLRPSDPDSYVVIAGPAPRSPSYPSELAVTAGAASEILAYLWPADAQYFRDAADSAANASMAAGYN